MLFSLTVVDPSGQALHLNLPDASILLKVSLTHLQADSDTLPSPLVVDPSGQEVALAEALAQYEPTGQRIIWVGSVQYEPSGQGFCN